MMVGRCSNSKSCYADFYCDTNISRCVPCSRVCDKNRGTFRECCSNCPVQAEQQRFTCPKKPPASAWKAPPILTTSYPTFKTRKPKRKHSRDPKARPKGNKKSAKQNRDIEIITETSTSQTLSQRSQTPLSITTQGSGRVTGLLAVTVSSKSAGMVLDSGNGLMYGLIAVILLLASIAVILLLFMWVVRRNRKQLSSGQYLHSPLHSNPQEEDAECPPLPQYSLHPDVTIQPQAGKSVNLASINVWDEHLVTGKAFHETGNMAALKVHGQDDVTCDGVERMGGEEGTGVEESVKMLKSNSN